MSRRPNDTDVEKDRQTPTTPEALPKASTLAPPNISAPPNPRVLAPRLPMGSMAKPGRREMSSDTAVTGRIERHMVEPTPAPLPPSPAAADAERWFEQVPTNPGAVPLRDPTGRELPRPSQTLPKVATAPQPPRAWLLPSLIVATALAVGMVLGALLFGHRGACAPCGGAASTAAPLSPR